MNSFADIINRTPNLLVSTSTEATVKNLAIAPLLHPPPLHEQLLFSNAKPTAKELSSFTQFIPKGKKRVGDLARLFHSSIAVEQKKIYIAEYDELLARLMDFKLVISAVRRLPESIVALDSATPTDMRPIEAERTRNGDPALANNGMGFVNYNTHNACTNGLLKSDPRTERNIDGLRHLPNRAARSQETETGPKIFSSDYRRVEMLEPCEILNSPKFRAARRLLIREKRILKMNVPENTLKVTNRFSVDFSVPALIFTVSLELQIGTFHIIFRLLGPELHSESVF
ncbi:hypothetical protein C8J56DRAFT_894255 [Mycena floridula]|nr:hypothetical protein C8J56DRAFT_894255 [Mycena floridula]